MLPVYESIFETQKMMVVILVQFSIELELGLAFAQRETRTRSAHQIQHRYFHHALVEIGGPILDDFHSDYFLGFEILTLDYLPEGALSEDVKNQIPIPTAHHKYAKATNSIV